MPSRLMFHTQEKREKLLSAPERCVRHDAWLGHGFYFWYDERDAIQWGYNGKKATGAFDIYQSQIDFEDVLDTVFNEEHYLFWLAQIEKAAKVLQKQLREKPTLKQINQYFKDRAIWDEVKGIMFQDLPVSNETTMVNGLFYYKRIQLAVYDTKIINTFVHYKSKSIV